MKVYLMHENGDNTIEDDNSDDDVDYSILSQQLPAPLPIEEMII